MRSDEIVEQTAEMLAARAATKGIELLCDPPAALPRVRVDAVRLRQVLVNLGGNAVKFTERGEVILRLGATVRRRRILEHPRFEVADTGVGHRAGKPGAEYSMNSRRRTRRPRAASAVRVLASQSRASSSNSWAAGSQ